MNKQANDTAGRDYVRFLLTRYVRNWYWFAGALAVSGLVTYLLLAMLKPVYSIQASLLINASEEGTTSPKEDILRELDMFSSSKNIEDEIEILKSYTLVEKVVSDLNLDVNYSVPDGLRERDVYRQSPVTITVITPHEAQYGKAVDVVLTDRGLQLAGATYPFNQPVRTPLGRLLIRRNPLAVRPYRSLRLTIFPKEDVIQAYLGRLKITQANRASFVLRIALDDTSIERGVAFVNRLIHWYDLSSLEYKNRTASSTLRFINDRLAIISRELTDVEKAIQRYKTRAGIVDLSAEATVFLDKVRENDAQLNQVNIQLGALSEIEKYMAARPGTATLAPALPGLDNPVLAGLLTNLFELEMQREKLLRSSPEGSTAVQLIDNQIRLAKTSIADNTQSLRKILLSTRQQVLSANKKAEAVIRAIPQKERGLLDISRQQGIKGELYTYLLQKREETALSLAAAVSDLRVIDAPRGHTRPIKPRPSVYYLFATLLGLLVPVGVLWLRDFLNNRISRRTDIEAATQAPIIGEVIQASLTTPLEVSPASRSMLTEQIRTLRANIHFMNPDAEGPQTILVTSSVSGEGKSFISLNLGGSLAITGRRVVLLELDLRKPKLHKYLGLSGQVGLSNFLVGTATLDTLIQPVPNYPDLFLIPCGPLPPNPSELLTSRRMSELFAALREGFDVILADTPPVGLVSDAFSIAPYANTTLYILRHLYTNKTYLKTIETLYQEKRFRNMSLLINGIVTRKEYEYRYGYGYDSEQDYTYRTGSGSGRDLPGNLLTKGFRFWRS